MLTHPLQMVDCCKSVSTFSVAQRRKIFSAFDKLREALSEVYSIDLDAPRLSCRLCFRPLKQFCCGLLERGTPHQWRSAVSKISSRNRLGLAASLFMFRKVLPSPDPDLDQYCHKMSEPSPLPDNDFLSFCRSEIAGLFPIGWDRGYADKVLLATPPTKSCLESSRVDGGLRGMTARGQWMSQEEYALATLTTPCAYLLKPSRVVSVETGGKKRIVSTPCANMNLLRPFHQTFYDRLSRFPWLLRGDASASKLLHRQFVAKDGELFVSGDYESATDNLNSNVQKSILNFVLRRCSHVPVGIMDMAVSSLHMKIQPFKSSEVYQQERGQLMGNLVSFPLLCLVNYLAFKYTVRRDVPVLINGDDILFRCKPEEYDRWAFQVGRSGLVLSPGKTMIHRKFGSINSTFFEFRSRAVERVPIIRSTAFGLYDRGSVSSLRGRYKGFASGFGNHRRVILDRLFLKHNSGLIHATNRSLTRGLGIRVSFEALCGASLWHRESFYLSMEKENPLPPEEGDVCWSFAIDGWRRLHGVMGASDVEAQKEHAALVVEQCWLRSFSPAQSSENYRASVKEGTFEFSSFLAWRKGTFVRRMLGLTACRFKEWCKPKRSIYETYMAKPLVAKRWFYQRVTERLSRKVIFVSSGFLEPLQRVQD